jgi:CRP-like cAMP-binding protein
MGDEGDCFYIIEQGQCECINADGEQVRVLNSGESFGEIAIIRNVKRTLTVKVLSDSCKLLVMSRDSFTRVLGSIEDKLPMDYDQDRAQKGLTPE